MRVHTHRQAFSLFANVVSVSYPSFSFRLSNSIESRASIVSAPHTHTPPYLFSYDDPLDVRKRSKFSNSCRSFLWFRRWRVRTCYLHLTGKSHHRSKLPVRREEQSMRTSLTTLRSWSCRYVPSWSCFQRVFDCTSEQAFGHMRPRVVWTIYVNYS